MKTRYPFKDIEKKWRDFWEKKKTDCVDMENSQNPFYNLMMFPYPSAEGLHVGNVFAFIGSDVQGRYRRLRGYDVFEPMGFDAFGIHSENFAMKKGIHPAKMIPENISRFRDHQLKKIGNMFDWSRQIDTTSADYYRWTQWIFIQLYKAGLAYRKKAPVNWCPSCKTVLAAEQVIQGACERCDTEVLKKEMPQWFFKTTAFAQRLLDNLDKLDWSEKTKTAQRNWIGRSEGAQVTFQVAGVDETFDVFTTRPDTLFGVTYVVFAPEHPLLDKIVSSEQRATFNGFRQTVMRKTDIERQSVNAEKSGFFTGAFAVNPVNEEKIPIWVSDYVLMGYGTGAVMAVPAHDQRDFEFATTFGLAIRSVILSDKDLHPMEAAYTGDGILVNSGKFSGMPAGEAGKAINKWLSEKGLARTKVHYRLRDWCVSRQRYWGPPIPVICCDQCGPLPVPEKDLPVVLPELENFQPDGSGASPLKRHFDFYHTRCPKCNGAAVRETDVSDNFLCSAWYFFRYPSTDCDDQAFDPVRTQKWLPVDLYVGGNEHAVLHLLYARFLCMAFHQMGLIDFEEPFKKFVAHGLLVRDGAKMSKSRGNVINPDDYIRRYGTDAFRVYLMFMGDYLEGGDFRDEGLKAMAGFLDRVWTAFQPEQLIHKKITDTETLYRLHSTIKAATLDIERFSYNTALARIMELLNHISKTGARYQSAMETLVILLSPFAPHLCEELWSKLGHPQSVFSHAWPEYEDAYTHVDTIEFVVQINGKVRAKMKIQRGMEKREIEKMILSNAAVKARIKDKTILKKIFIPGKLVNLVLK